VREPDLPAPIQGILRREPRRDLATFVARGRDVALDAISVRWTVPLIALQLVALAAIAYGFGRRPSAPPLSALTGAEVYVKYENLQVTNSFKERGACVKLAALTGLPVPQSAADLSRGIAELLELGLIWGDAVAGFEQHARIAKPRGLGFQGVENRLRTAWTGKAGHERHVISGSAVFLRGREFV